MIFSFVYICILRDHTLYINILCTKITDEVMCEQRYLCPSVGAPARHEKSYLLQFVQTNYNLFEQIVLFFMSRRGSVVSGASIMKTFQWRRAVENRCVFSALSPLEVALRQVR